MKRLTEKANHYCDTDIDNKYKFADEDTSIGTIVDKLGQLENLEEEIGCPLEFTSTPYRFSGLRKIWYHKQWCEVVRIVVYEEMTRPYMEVICKGYKRLKMIFLDDYKNTWWLKENKEE